MTVMMETSRLPVSHEEEMAQTMTMLLDRYLGLLMEDHGDLWSKDEEDTVRQVREVLTRAGYAPNLSYEVRSHLDYPTFSR